jgi:alkanesulfonate monooxygenase SsuD/methylene tetrahydromethanopterin reductase-like flavin-dependent oxidoreductase (luciferase family)
MDVYFTIRSAPLDELRERVAWLEAHGAAGVLCADHLFIGGDRRPRSEARRGSEPIVLLATIAAMSDRLAVGTSVSNIGFLHPALVLRQFAQLAVLFGGDRVLAGLGAGWNREEFDALGMRMPPFAQRMDRLEEASRLARALFDNGIASLERSHIVARELPLAPLPQKPPRLLLGGGSDRLLEIAGRYADALDLNGTSQAGALRGQNLPQADQQRRLSTTVSGLSESVRRVKAVAKEAGRPPDSISMSVLISRIVFCDESQRAEEANRIRTSVGLPEGSLDECPYVLIGEPERMVETLREWQARFDLKALLLMSTVPTDTTERFLSEVISRVQ